MAIPTIPLPSGETARLPAHPDTSRISPGAFGAGLGEGLVQGAAGLDKVMAEADALRAQEAETAYAQEILRTVHGAKDPDSGEFKPGFSNLKGHQAIDASAPLAQSLAKRRNQIASELRNDRQRRIFLGRTQADLLGATRAIESHVGAQVSYLQREGLKTQLETAAQTAAAAVVSSAGVVDLIGADRQVQATKPWLEVAAERAGLKGDDAVRFVREGQAGIVTAAMERLLEDPPKSGRGHAKEAKAWLEANRALLDPKDAARYGARLAAATLRDDSVAEADRIWREAGGEPGKALDLARALPDASLRSEVEKEIGQRLREDHAARVAADAPRIARLEVDIYQGRGLNRRAQDYLALSDEGRAAVEAKALGVQSARRAASGEARRLQNEADRLALAEFDAIAQNDLEGATKLDVRERWGAAVSPTALETLKAAQGKARKAWDKDRGVSEAEFHRLVKEEVKGVITDEKKDLPRFLGAVGRERQRWVEANPGKEPPRAEVQRWIAEQLEMGATRGLFGTALQRNRPRYKVPADSEFVPDPDDEDRQELNRRRGAGARAPAGLPRPATIEEARALPPGTRFLDPDGVERVR